MNELHRAVLTKHSADMVRDMIASETLIGATYQRKIFDQEMVELIRACRTPSEQIYKILELLPKRGPDAFSSFMEILHEQYDWLERLIQESLVTEAERLQQEKQQVALARKEEENAFTPRAPSSFTHLDYDIKARTSAFIQRQFGQVRRISNTDKKSMEKWLVEWLQHERRHLEKAFRNANPVGGEKDIFDNMEVKEKIFSLYLYITTKLKKPKKKVSIKDTEGEADGEDDDKASLMTVEREITADDADFSLLWAEIDEVFTEYQGMSKQIRKSYDYIGVRETERELSLIVHDLCGEYRLREKELVKERKKIESMLVELYNYSTETQKMQHCLKNQEEEIVELKEQINKMRQENIELIKEITALERANIVHMEKEKTLDQLIKAKEDLQTLIKAVNQENKELKQQVQGTRGPLRNGLRGFQSRRPQANSTNPNTSKVTNTNTGPKKVVPKKRSNSMRY